MNSSENNTALATLIAADALEPGACRLCGRVMQRGTTEHHLIPRTLHNNKWFRKRYGREQMNQTISVCRDCHHAIHQFIPSEKDLGRHYASVEALLAHPKLGGFVAWVRKQK